MNVLILRPDHIGDMLLTTPFLAAMRKSFPDWNITVLCGSWSMPILKGNPNFNNVAVCDFPWLARGSGTLWNHLFSTISELRKSSFDIVINLRIAAKEAVMAKIIGGRQILGFDMGKSKWAHGITVPYRTDCHIADLYLEFADVLGGEKTHNGLELFLSGEDISSNKHIRNLPEKYVICAPGAGYKSKFWVPERWSVIADWIVSELNIPILFTGSLSEKEMIEHIAGKMSRCAVNLAGQTSIRETAVLIKRALFLVSVDSAAMHIASAVDTPVVALFGPTNPAHWGPYPNNCPNQIISKMSDFELFRGSFTRKGGMDLIQVEDIKLTLEELCKRLQC
ncbi:glycosyltransferase family 9 protein [candidate division KSB1 bacterium]